MKIRGKIIILELIIGFLLFIGLLVAISNFTAVNSFEDIKVKYHSAFSALDEIMYSMQSILLEPVPDEDLAFQEISDKLEIFNRTYQETKVSIKKTRMPKQLQKNLLAPENEAGRILNNETRSRLFTHYQELLALDETSFLENHSLASVKIFLENREDTELFYDSTVAYIDEYREVMGNLDSYAKRLEAQYDTLFNHFRILRKRNLIMAGINSGLFLLMVILIVVIFSGVISRRIKKIDKGFEIVASGDFSTHLDMTTDDEFGTLSRNFNSLVDSLRTKLESLRQIMHDVGETISNEIDLSKVENTIVYLAQKNTTADGVALYKIAGEDKALRLQYGIGDFRPPYKSQVMEKAEKSQKVDPIPLLRQEQVPLRGNILGEAAMQARSYFIRNVGLNRPELKRDPDDPLYLSSCIAIPLRIGNNILGVLCLVKTKGFEYFSDLEYSNMQSFTELSAITIDNLNKYSEMLEAFELNREIGIASEIQQNLLPSKLPQIDNFDISFFYKPLKGINGDFFDVIPLGYDKILFAVCEVAGKGVPAALVMVMIRTILRLIASPVKNAGQMLTELNQNITEKVQIENFASMGLLIVNKKSTALSFSAASHHALHILRSESGEFEHHDVGGIPVGIDYSSKYEDLTVEVKNNDLLILYTDGVPEARNRSGREYTVESLLEMVQSNKDKSAEELATTIEEDLDYFEQGAKIYDDKTFFVMKYRGGNEN